MAEPQASGHGDQAAATRGGSDLDARFPGKYLSVTSFKRDGTPVATPVWFATENGRLLIFTDPNSFKAKRIRRNPSVRVAPCNATGKQRGESAPATAEFLPEDQNDHVMSVINHKYRVDRILKLPFYNLVQRLRGKQTSGPITTLAITPDEPA